MSAPRLISPLLDNFVMGEPIFEQGGVRILPAMDQTKDEKYIVKIVSIPASQSQVDALLITGAYKDAESVNGYFAELADGVVREAGVLSQLSNAGGFDGYVNMQVVPMDDGNGYDVYLLAPYRPTWERVSQQKTATHLDGYNLALDLCAALSVARRNGYMYANLRPESVSVTSTGSYHICDLGLLHLDYLQYSSMPSGYFSPYTAPEITDAYSFLNATIDVYALGMMLYELFNGGLPFDGSHGAGVTYPAPRFAEEEFGQIILKAIHPDPAQRWQDPTEMGQAVVSVMQRKGVSDAPIIPEPEIIEEVLPEEEPVAEEVEAPIEEMVEQAQSDISEETADDTQVAAEDEIEVLQVNAAEEVIEDVQPEAAEAPDEEIVNAAVMSSSEAENVNEQEDTAVETEDVYEDAEPVQESPEAEGSTASANEAEEMPAEASVEDKEDILLEADKLIADLQVDTDAEQDPDTYEQLAIEQIDEDANIEKDLSSPSPLEDAAEEEPVGKKSRKGKLLIICAALLVVILLVGGLYFYRHIYMQEINDLTVTGVADTVTVTVDADIDSSKLSVVCIDANGNQFEVPLVDYSATISGLSPATEYTVSLNVSGFNKLFGDTECTYTSPEMTVISDFAVLNGPDEGSAQVTFQVSGPNEGSWSVTFKAQDEDAKIVTAENGVASVTGLTAGKEYTVTLSSSAPLYIGETVQATFVPGPVVKPVDPYVQSCTDGKLTVKWSAPADSTVQSWVVRCYNENGFDEKVTVEDTTAVFSVPDDKKAYRIEISAAGQAAKESLEVTENAITLSGFTVDTTSPGVIKLTWNSNADIPEGGYKVSYTVDNIPAEATLSTTENSVILNTAVPNAVHSFKITSQSGQSVLHEPVSATATGKNVYSGFGVHTNTLRFNLCPRPAKANWAFADVKPATYTTTFSVGQKASLVCRILTMYYTSNVQVRTLYVFRDANNEIAHFCSVEQPWGTMWYNGFGTFDIPSLPTNIGTYTMDMYFDGCLVFNSSITIK